MTGNIMEIPWSVGVCKIAGGIAIAVLVAVSQAGIAADTFPQKPIRLVVPFPPGGANDTIGRIVSTGLTERLGQQVIVDNKPGAGQVIGTDVVAKAAPNGYTLLLASSTHGINPGLLQKLPYDSVNDFVPITRVATAPSILVVSPSLGVNGLKQLIALAKAKPGALTYASSGVGSGGHMKMALLEYYTKTEMLHVPYKGASPAMTDLLSGRVNMMITSPANVIGYIKSGKLVAIGMTEKNRSKSVPDIPTLAEGGLPDYDAPAWYALLAPAHTPNDVIEILSRESRRVLQSPEAIARLADSGLEPDPSTPQETATFIKREIDKWEKVVKAAGIKPE